MTPTSDPTEPMAALGRIPSGLFILTARQGERETGMLASWVQQCSFDPPQISVAVKRDRDLMAWLTPGAAFTLNLLAEGQNSYLRHFGKGFGLEEPAFVGLNVERPTEEGPILTDALGHLFCRVAGQFAGGDHDILVGRVVGGKLNQGERRPMVHVRKSGSRY